MADQLFVPRHVGYVIDGNRRWARTHGLPTYEGHLAGYNALKDVSVATLEAGVEFMSIYIFSTENWKRSQEEVKGLMGLVLRLFTTDAKMFSQHNIKLKVLGVREGLDPKILTAMDKLEESTKDNTAGTLAICLNYGGQHEIVDAVKKIVQSGAKAEDVTSDLIAENLYGAEVPPVDVIVRTSGEKRLSNFMLWRAAYSEFIF
jgi:undecaprenyl diphosphate synthase